MKSRIRVTVLFLAAVLGAVVILWLPAQNDAVQTLFTPPPAVSTTPSRVAITIDDLPFVLPSRTSPAEGLSYVEEITSALQEHGIIATGFVVGQQLNADSAPALRAFADAGHTIGNHSWSHPDYGSLTAEEFRGETRRTDHVLTEWIIGPRYYQFPYLREGETEATKTAANLILTELGYQNVPVTIDNDDWRFNADDLDAHARCDSAAAAQIAVACVAHMQERTAYFVSAVRTFGSNWSSPLKVVHQLG